MEGRCWYEGAKSGISGGGRAATSPRDDYAKDRRIVMTRWKEESPKGTRRGRNRGCRNLYGDRG